LAVLVGGDTPPVYTYFSACIYYVSVTVYLPEYSSD